MDKSLELMQKFLNLNDEAKPSDYKSLADIYMKNVEEGIDKENNFKKSLKVYDDVIKKYPQLSAWAYLRKANNSYNAEYDDLTIEFSNKVIEIIENKSDRDDLELGYLKQAYRFAGYTYWNSKDDFNTAKVYLNKLYDLDPDDSIAKQAHEVQQEENGDKANVCHAPRDFGLRSHEKAYPNHDERENQQQNVR